VSYLFFYQFALIALAWLSFLLFYAWPSDRARRPHAAVPIAPRRQRSTDPKPFVGLAQKPHCALCEHDLPHPRAPAARPDPLSPTHRRPRTIDTSKHFCPHTGCCYHGWLGLGISVLTAIPVVRPGANSTAPRAKAIFPSIMARSCMEAGPRGADRARAGVFG
jgi:hypothetical protein